MNTTCTSVNSETIVEQQQQQPHAQGAILKAAADCRLTESGYTSQENGEACENTGDEFTIVTTVEESPAHVKHTKPLDNDSDVKDVVSDDFSIVTYVDNDSSSDALQKLLFENGETGQNMMSSNETGTSNLCSSSNDICSNKKSEYVAVNDTGERSNSGCNFGNDACNNTNDPDKTSNSKCGENINDMCTSNTCTANDIPNNVHVANTTSHDVHRDMDKPNNTLHDVERSSTIIEGEEVELRTPKHSGNKPLVHREPTWRAHQKVVSNAFGFLMDIEGVRDTIAVTSDELLEISHTDNREFLTNGLNSLTETGSSVSEYSIPIYATVNKQKVSKDSDNDFTPIYAKVNKDTTSSVSGDSVQLCEKVCKSKSLRRAQAVDDYETIVVDSVPKIETEAKDTVRAATNSIVSTSEADELGELPKAGAKLRNRRKHRPSHDEEDDDGGSSDDDKGVYQESFRKSTWLYVGDNDEPVKNSDYVCLANLSVNSCDDDIFGDDPVPTSPRPTHQRNDSTATTASEALFRNTYNSVSKRYVQRSDSQQQYKRMTARFYDREKQYTLTKDERNSGYGIHILDSQPAVITAVDAGSPAEAAGLKEGQILISINSVNVLEAKHEEILQLVSQNASQLVLEVGHSDISHLRNLQEPVLTGTLQKQTTTTIFKSWKRRYFILRRDYCLYYYKNEKEADPLGAIPLTGYTFSRHGDLSKFGFKAEKYSNRTYYFMADTREDMARWVGALNESAMQGKTKKDSWIDVTTENVGLPALEIRKPDCSGYVYKMGRSARRWYKRYCVLKDACIYYYKNSNSREAEGVAHLHGYVVNSTGVSGKKNSFCLSPPESQMRVFSFYTDNETDKLRWLDALSTSIEKWVKVE